MKKVIIGYLLALFTLAGRPPELSTIFTIKRKEKCWNNCETIVRSSSSLSSGTEYMFDDDEELLTAIITGVRGFYICSMSMTSLTRSMQEKPYLDQTNFIANFENHHINLDGDPPLEL